MKKFFTAAEQSPITTEKFVTFWWVWRKTKRGDKGKSPVRKEKRRQKVFDMINILESSYFIQKQSTLKQKL